MTEIQAAVLTNLDGSVEVFDGISHPDLSEFQVFVKIFYSGVCRSQLMEVEGSRGDDPWLPHMLGHEASGKVMAVGSGVTKLKVGDLVVATWIKGEGGESGGTQYIGQTHKINAGAITTFSNFAIISENRLVKLDPRVPLDLAVTLGCAVPTGAGMVFNQIENPNGKTLAIFGLGGIGLAALLAAKNRNFSKIVVVDIDERKLDIAAKLGVDSVVNASIDDPVVSILEFTAGGADFCIDASGHCKVIEQAFLSSKPRHGVTLFASHPPEGEMLSISPHDLISGRRLIGSWGGDTKPDRDIPFYCSLYLAGKFDLGLLVNQKYELRQVNDALHDLKHGVCHRPVIQMKHD